MGSRWLWAVVLVVTALCLVGFGPFRLGGDAGWNGEYPRFFVNGCAGARCGFHIRFKEQASFTWFYSLVNVSPVDTTILDVKASGPSNGLLRQTAATFVRWPDCNSPPGSEGGCFPPIPRLHAAVTLPPGGRAYVGIRYRFVDCEAARTATTESPSRLAVFFKSSSSSGRQLLPLGRLQLTLQRPTAAQCPR